MNVLEKDKQQARLNMKERLVAALRSGEYAQGTGALRRGDSFCCLGVLCDLAAQDGNGEWVYGCTYTYEDSPSDDLPGVDLLAEYGLKESDLFVTVSEAQRCRLPDDRSSMAGIGMQFHLASLNDSGVFPFSEIADLIEAQW